jgi:hypothetical protein
MREPEVIVRESGDFVVVHVQPEVPLEIKNKPLKEMNREELKRLADFLGFPEE